ncbi:DNA-directed RNA polymerase [Lithospermum erythrorhizon]|uniref:DNA-directed RNA polymerase n=1 Tax=Lithospermum erythrorhizon TaxID=34254 RepID=A0AAV3QM69_LITER
MADMELDLDVPTQAPPKPTSGTRFLPRGSKRKPEPEPITQFQYLESNPTLEVKKNEPNEVVSMDVDLKRQVKIEETVDEVVNEIDVYFSPSIHHNTKLYVLQYPLRPLWRPYELDERCKEVRVKTDSGEVEIDLAIDVDSDLNYDHNADPRIKITKQTLSSSWRPPARTAYAVGVLTGNELHLNPVHAVMQLRPSLEHLKPGGSLEKSAGDIKGEGIIKVEELKQERLSGSSVKQSKSHGELSERARDCQEWLPLQYYGARSDISASCLHKMMEKEGAHIPFLMCPHDYINTLCPGTSNNDIKVRGPSIRSLCSLPLDERFKVWFREGHAVSRFDTLKHLAMEESDEEILQIILKYARLVQGNWVAKSPLVYGKDTGPEVVARDNVLAQFRKNLLFSSKQLPQRPDLRKATKDVLTVFARPSGSDWKFDTPRDTTFLKLHPSIEEQQEESWKKLEEQINSILGKNRSKTVPKSAVPVNPVPGKSLHKTAGSKVQNGTMHKSMPGETKEALLNALKSILGQGGFRLSQICEHLRNQAVVESRHPKISIREAVAVAGAIESFPDDFHTVTNEVAVNIHGIFVLRSSPDNSQHDPLRKVVIDLLIGQGPDAKIKKASVAEAAKLQLGRDMSNEEFRKVITELCVPQRSAWILKAGDGNPNVK